MMLLVLLAAPFAAAIASFGTQSDFLRRRLVVAVSFLHLAVSALLWAGGTEPGPGDWIGADALSLLFLLITSLLFAASSISLARYLEDHELQENKRGRFSREAVFTGTFSLFLGTATLAILSRHTGVFWLAIEGTTLASATLISYQRSSRSLEAAWKYMLICSVGIALALAGNTALAVSALFSPEAEPISMTFRELGEKAHLLNPLWLKTAYACILVGYGTKMGLAPMHTWLPDAHSEAPSPISALLSGALLNCAFLGILRTNGILLKAGMGWYSNGLLVAFGVFSMVLAGLLLLQQGDYKRLLAYSSIEHMGILAIAAGSGASFGCFLHSVNHSLSKGALFLIAGELLHAFHTKSTRNVTGILHAAPMAGILWIAGFLSICGIPPFGTFVSEFLIMASLAGGGRWWLLGIFLLSLGVVFAAVWRIVIPMAYGEPPELREGIRDSTWLVPEAAAPALLLLAVVLLGLWIPGPLARLLERAAAVAGGA